jgi:transcriptional regulator with XRE-family HTH domain
MGSMDDLSVIARRLREARERAGVSQKALGILAGIDEFTSSARVNQYERGKHIPDLLTLENFAIVLHVPVEFFFAQDDKTAQMLLLFSRLSAKQKDRIISQLRKNKVSE